MSPRALAAPLCLAFFALVGCGPIDLETMGADEADLGQTLRLFKSTDAPTTPAANDGSSVELGVKWRSDVDGQLLGVRFYKGPGNGGAHTGTLWTASGQRLATAAFGQETTAGWQRVRFAQPVQVRAGEVYVASYHAPAGHYAYSYGAFRGAGIDRGPLHALASGASGANGVFRYASSVAFPDQSYRDTNYWVDVIFAPAQVAPPVVDAGAVTPPVVDAGAVTPPVVDAGAVTPPVVDAGTVTPPP
ncbi:MAG: DUF4082 domain-containing protein [Archangiaceae bacterium]|nr:DUF4082 domain-containing protein [Archangiaceae bacterium]